MLVYLLGMWLNGRIAPLRSFNIPEPVTGGILAAVAALGVYAATGTELHFDLERRDLLLIYFFTAIGINARAGDLLSGGRPLAVLLALTVVFIGVQNTIGLVAAHFMGLPGAIGVLTGSASLIGGHGTAIAWTPEIASGSGLTNALEIGTASATLGLVLASLLGGPIARFLLTRHRIADLPRDDLLVGIAYEPEEPESVDHVDVVAAFLVIHVSMILGWFVAEALEEAGLRLPLFVTCMFVAILLSNTIPRVLPGVRWPARTKALSLISDFSLGLFIAMSLMSMRLWSIADLAGPLVLLLAAQALAAVLFILFVVFPLMGRNYMATVLSAGFAGFSLGATPTAVANMTAVAKEHGPAPTAFIILPLVGAFFVDITNAFAIRFFLGLAGGAPPG